MKKKEILKLEKGNDTNKLIFELITKPEYYKTQFCAMTEEGDAYYISFNTEDEFNSWVERLKISTQNHPYLTQNGFMEKKISYPNYSGDLNTAFEIEDKINELNLKEYYISDLCYVTCNCEGNSVDTWELIHSSSLNRCKAGLLALNNLEKIKLESLEELK
jgi:hypothetical protein